VTCLQSIFFLLLCFTVKSASHPAVNSGLLSLEDFHRNDHTPHNLIFIGSDPPLQPVGQPFRGTHYCRKGRILFLISLLRPWRLGNQKQKFQKESNFDAWYTDPDHGDRFDWGGCQKYFDKFDLADR
jgi:hypothetical protein